MLSGVKVDLAFYVFSLTGKILDSDTSAFVFKIIYLGFFFLILHHSFPCGDERNRDKIIQELTLFCLFWGTKKRQAFQAFPVKIISLEKHKRFL